MAISRPNVVLVQVNGAERPVLEKPAATTIYPGDLVEVTSASALTPVASAGKVVGRAFALENPFAPDPTQSALAQAYAANDQVQHTYAQSGDLVNARLAASQTVAVGDVLASSDTAGCLAKITVDATTLAGAPVAIAEEAVTTTGSTGRILARVL